LSDEGEDPWIGARLGNGRYEVAATIGGGGMGAVYRARDAEAGRDVALKLLHARLSVEGRHLERFRREAEVASALSHPNVVSVLDHGEEEDGTPWMAMELVEGESLSQLLAREGAIDPRRALRIVRQVAFALGAVHAVGIVHRDLKPGNIMLVQEPTPDRVKVVDFGLARFFASDTFQKLTMTGQVVGTPAFMAPEQAFGDNVDERTDVYSMGAVLYSLLTARPPYEGRGVEEILPKLLDGDREPLVRSHPKLGALAEVVDRCLEPDPDARYATAAEVDAALSVLDPTPTQTLAEWAPPPSMPTLRLAPDPVLDAPRPLSRTAFTRALRARAPVPPPVAPVTAGEPTKTTPSRATLIVAAAVAAVVGAGIVAFGMTLGEEPAPPPVVQRGAELDVAQPAVTPVALDAGRAEDAAPDVAEAITASAEVGSESEELAAQPRASRASREAPSGSGVHADGIHLAVRVVQTNIEVALVRSGMTRATAALARCYDALGPDHSMSPSGGSIRYLEGGGSGASTYEANAQLDRDVSVCVRTAFADGLPSIAARDYDVHIYFRVTPAERTRITVFGSGLALEAVDESDLQRLRVSLAVVDPGAWTAAEVLHTLDSRRQASEQCFNALTTAPTVPYAVTLGITYQANGRQRGYGLQDGTHNIGSARDCLGPNLGSGARLPPKGFRGYRDVALRVTVSR